MSHCSLGDAGTEFTWEFCLSKETEQVSRVPLLLLYIKKNNHGSYFKTCDAGLQIWEQEQGVFAFFEFQGHVSLTSACN